MFNKKKEIAIGISVPVEADAVLSPTVVYGNPQTAIYFEDEQGKNCRVTFERFDSLKICRGEFCPYEDDWEEHKPYYWVSKVVNSSWLRERYKYESRYYKTCYGFGDNVDEMLSEFSHYLFSFHDQFVEVIAGGIWFEKSESLLFGEPLGKNHPFSPLPHEQSELMSAHGIKCYIRKNPADERTIVNGAKYCSQPLLEFAPDLDGCIKSSIYLYLRYRHGKLTSVLTRDFGGEIAQFDGIASLDMVRPYIDSWLSGISQRRAEMGK